MAFGIAFAQMIFLRNHESRLPYIRELQFATFRRSINCQIVGQRVCYVKIFLSLDWLMGCIPGNETGHLI